MSDSEIQETESTVVEARRRTPEQGIALWVDLMEASHQFLLAGLRRKVGPRGDVKAAYREWYARQMDAHDQMMLDMMQRFDRRNKGDGW